jgi:hypothetical protein
LVSKQHVTKQAAFLILAVRARLLALSGALAPQIARVCGCSDQRAIESLIDVEVRAALDELSDLPQRVVDPRWIETLDEHEVPFRIKFLARCLTLLLVLARGFADGSAGWEAPCSRCEVGSSSVPKPSPRRRCRAVRTRAAS